MLPTTKLQAVVGVEGEVEGEGEGGVDGDAVKDIERISIYACVCMCVLLLHLVIGVTRFVRECRRDEEREKLLMY